MFQEGKSGERQKMALVLTLDSYFAKEVTSGFQRFGYQTEVRECTQWRQSIEEVKPDYLVLDDYSQKQPFHPFVRWYRRLFLPDNSPKENNGGWLRHEIRKDQSVPIPILLLASDHSSDLFFRGSWIYSGDFFGFLFQFKNGELEKLMERAEVWSLKREWKWNP